MSSKPGQVVMGGLNLDVMKKYSFIAMLAIAAMAAFSCAKEAELKQDEVQQEPEKVFVPKVISAFTDDDVKADTKTSLSGVSVLWATTDNIKGIDGVDAIHTSTSTAVSIDQKEATFTFSTVSVEDDLLFLAYPAENVSNIDGDYVYATLPSTQTATANSFANKANIAIAEGLAEHPVFKNVGGLLSFTINNDNIKSVTLSANEDLTGASKISVAGATFAKATITSGKKFVTLEGTIANGTEYYAVVYPGTYTDLTIEVTDASGRVAKYTNPNSLTVERNGNLHIATLTIPDGKWEAIEKGVEYVMTPATNCWSGWAIYNLNGMSWTPALVSGNDNPAPGSYTAGKGYQFGTGSKGIVNMTLTGSGYTQKSKTQSGNAKAFGITDITVSLAAKKSNVYTVTATVGGVTVESSKNATGNGDTPVEVSFHSDTKLAGEIVISYVFSGDAANAGYLSINTITINHDARTNVALSFDEDAIDDQTTVSHTFTGQAVSSSPDVTAITSNITWSITGDAITSSFNTSTGELVLNGSAGTATVTASFAGDENYKSANASYTITVSKVKLATPTSPVAAEKSGDDAIVVTLPTGVTNVGSYSVTCTGETTQVVPSGTPSVTFSSLADGSYTVDVTAIPTAAASATYENSDAWSTPSPIVIRTVQPGVRHNASYEGTTERQTDTSKNDYTSEHSWTVSGISWIMRYADAVSNAGRLNGDGDLMARIAKNATTTPYAYTANILSSSKTITKITFLSKLSSMTLTVKYSTDGSTWNTLSYSKDTTVDETNGYSATLGTPVSCSDFRLKFEWSRSSGSARIDSQLDDVTVLGY